MIVVPEPSSSEMLDFVDAVKHILRQPFVAHRSVESLDVCVLLRFAGLNVFDLDRAPSPRR